MATNLSRIGSELQVNIDPNQDGYQVDADVAALTSGRFFTAFTDEGRPAATTSSGNSSASTAPASRETSTSKPTSASSSTRRWRSVPNGAAVVVWTDEQISDEIHYAIVSSAGTVGTEKTILDGNPLDDADVATLADGRSLVVAEQFNPTTDDDIVFRFIDANGRARRRSPGFHRQRRRRPDRVRRLPPSATTRWSSMRTSTAPSSQIQARFFNGTSFAAEVTIVTLPDYDSETMTRRLPDVAALTDGRFIVVWKNEQRRSTSKAGS